MAQHFPDNTPSLKTQLTHTSRYDTAFEDGQDGRREHILPLPGPKKPLPCTSQRSTRPAAVPTFITSTNRDRVKHQRRGSSRSPSVSNSSRSRASDQDSYSGSTSDIEQASPNVRVTAKHALTESQSGHCRNCAAIHEPAKNMWYRDCLVVSIRIKRRLHGFDKGVGPSVLTLPPSRKKRAAIGTQIWEAFERMKQANEEEREVVKQGKKRDVAPIPWLRFTGKDGRSHQTRNEQNYKSWWMDNVVTGVGTQLPLTHLTVLFDWKDN